MSVKLTPAVAEAIYDVVVEICGANPDPREKWSYVRYATGEEQMASEWRFQGYLGFGGKIKNNADRVYVCCYRENENEKRLDLIKQTNERLDTILKDAGLFRE